MKKGSMRIETELLRKNGEIVPIEISNAMVEINNKEYMQGVFRDIRERKKAEKELIESEALFRSLYENSFDAILLTKPDGSILAANPAAQQLFLMSEQEIIKVGRDGLVVKDELLEHAIIERDKKGNVKSELNFRRKNGSIFRGEGISNVFKDADGSLKTSMIIRDLTERKKIEDELRKAHDHLEDQVRERTKELDKAYKLLKASESQFRTLTENSIDIIARYDTDFRVRYINSGSEILGIEKEEFISKTFRDLGIDEDLVNLWEYNLQKALKTKKIQFFEYNLPGIKEIRTFSSYIIPEISEGKVNSLLGVSRDITKRKKAEEILKERESQYRTLTENSPDLIIRIDKDMRYVYMNSIVKELTGKSPDDFVGKTMEEVGLPQEYIKLWGDLYKKTFDTCQPQEIEYKFNSITGLRIYESTTVPEYNSKGEVETVLSVSRDITERKRSEEQIKRRNLILRGINEIFQTGLKAETEEHLAQTALTIVEKITKSNFGFICELNSEGLLDTTAIAFTGWEECIIPHSRQLIMSTDLPIRGIMGQVIQEAKPMIFNDANKHPEWIEPPEGHTKIKSFLGVPLIYAGKVFGEIGLAHKEKDYTMEDLEAVESLSFAIVEALMGYRARNQLNETINELERSNQELQSFAYITSHDLQEPLRTIASYAGLLKMRYEGQLDEDADEFIDFMVSGATRMKAMVQGLLDYSRVRTQEGEFKEFSSEKALNNALSNLYSAVKDCQSEIIHGKLPIISGDEDQITRVFQNLIGNALKFRKKDVRPKIHVSAKKEVNEHVFCVSDNGIGIEEQYSDRIFEVFKRLHAIDEYQGAGIGLAIVKRIIDKHGGRIWVKSSLGK